MFTLKQVQMYVEVVDCKSFSKAARNLNNSKANISTQILKLEDELKTHFLNRDSRNFSLTDQGEKFYTQCHGILKDVKKMQQFIKSEVEEPEGVLNIMGTLAGLNKYIIRHLEEFNQMYPKVEVRLESKERQFELDKEDLDIIFGYRIFKPAPYLAKIEVGKFNTCLCASPAYLKKYGMPAAPEDLVNYHYLQHTANERNNSVPFKDAIVEIPLRMQADSFEAIVNAAINDCGFVWVPESYVREHLDNGELVQVFAEHEIDNKETYLYYNKDIPLSSKVLAFLKFYQEKLGFEWEV